MQQLMYVFFVFAISLSSSNERFELQQGSVSTAPRTSSWSNVKSDDIAFDSAEEKDESLVTTFGLNDGHRCFAFHYNFTFYCFPHSSNEVGASWNAEPSNADSGNSLEKICQNAGGRETLSNLDRLQSNVHLHISRRPSFSAGIHINSTSFEFVCNWSSDLNTCSHRPITERPFAFCTLPSTDASHDWVRHRCEKSKGAVCKLPTDKSDEPSVHVLLPLLSCCTCAKLVASAAVIHKLLIVHGHAIDEFDLATQRRERFRADENVHARIAYLDGVVYSIALGRDQPDRERDACESRILSYQPRSNKRTFVESFRDPSLLRYNALAGAICAFSWRKYISGGLLIAGGAVCNGTKAVRMALQIDPGINQFNYKIRLSNMSVARAHLSLVALSHFGYAVGGSDGERVHKSVERYDASSRSWSPVTNMSIERQKSCAVVLGHRIFVIGGASQNDQGLASVEFYDVKTEEWNFTQTSMSAPRVGAAACVYRDKIYVVGGLTSGDADWIEVYDPSSDAWARLGLWDRPYELRHQAYGVCLLSSADFADAEKAQVYPKVAAGERVGENLYPDRGEHIWLVVGDQLKVLNFSQSRWIDVPVRSSTVPHERAVGANGRIYAFQSHSVEAESKCSESVDQFDIEKGVWEVVEDIRGRNFAQLCWLSGKLFAIGGVNCTTMDAVATVEVLDNETRKWHTTRSMQVKRHDHAVVALSGYAYVVGGLRNGAVLKSVERYDPKSDAWSSVADLNTPRYALIACVVSEKLYAVGGRESDGVFWPLSTVEVYDEASQTWQFVAAVTESRRNFQVPSAASRNGLLYVLWTALPYIESTSVLAVYNPQTDCWQSFSAEMVQPSQIKSAGLLSMPVSFRTWEFQRKKLLLMHETEGRRELDFASHSWAPAQPWTPAERSESGIILGSIVSLHGELYGLQYTSWSCELQMAMYNRTTRTWLKVGKMLRIGGRKYDDGDEERTTTTPNDDDDDDAGYEDAVCSFTPDRRQHIEALAADETRFFASLSNVLIAFDSQTKNLKITREMLSSRTGYAVAVYLNRAYVVGGVKNSSRMPDDVVQEYDFATDGWRFVARMNEKRKDLSVVVADGLLYTFGGVGITKYGINCLQSAEVYDPLSNRWRLLSPMLLRRTLAKAVSYNGLIYVFGGGYCHDATTAIQIYNPSIDEWSLSSARLPALYEASWLRGFVLIDTSNSHLRQPSLTWSPQKPYSGGATNLSCTGEVPEGAKANASSCIFKRFNTGDNSSEVLEQTEDAQVDKQRRTVTITSTILDLRSQPETYECVCFHGGDSNSTKAVMRPLESVAPSTNHSVTYTYDVLPGDPPRQLACQFDGIPAPRIVWFRNAEEVDFRNKDMNCVVTLLDDAKTLIQVTHVTADRCTLECRASNFLGNASVKYTLNRVDPPPTAVIATVVVACFVVICCFAISYRRIASFITYYRRKQIEAKKMTLKNAIKNKINEESANELTTVHRVTFRYKNLPDHIRDEINKIPYQWIQSVSFVSSGHFGHQFRGTLRVDGDRHRVRDVAIKCLKLGTADVGQFLNEALVMQRFQHERVLPLLGISFFKHGPLIVTPFMANGDLHSYLSNEKNAVDQRQLLKFALQIAEGMDYVAGLGVVHRDLACRNCLLDSSYEIKICDFGLCRDVDNTGYYKGASQAVPIKNLAPESIRRRAYNSKTDVWSYGVTLWEMWSRGATLYDHIDMSADTWIDQLLEELDAGVRLEIPEFCPPVIYEKVMLNCWHENSHERPDFNTLCTLVEEVTAYCRDEVPANDLEDGGFDEARNVFLNTVIEVAAAHSSANVAAHDPTSPLLRKADGDNGEAQVACDSSYAMSK